MVRAAKRQPPWRIAKGASKTDSITESAVLYNMNNRHSTYVYFSYCTPYQRINIAVSYATEGGGFIAHHKLFWYNMKLYLG